MSLSQDALYSSLGDLQIKLFSLQPEELISTFNACNNMLLMIAKQNPAADNYVKTTLGKNSCILNVDDLSDLKGMLTNVGATQTLIDSIIIPVQSGGVGETQLMSMQRNSTSSPSMQSSPDPIGNMTNILLSGAQAGMSQEELVKIMNRMLDIENKKLDIKSEELSVKKYELTITSLNERFANTFFATSTVGSLGVSGALLYYLKSVVSATANGIVNKAGTVASTVVGSGELAVRNVLPLLLGTAKSLAKTAISTGYVPDVVTSTLKTSKDYIAPNMFDYVTESMSGAATQNLAASIATNTDNAILFASLFLYIAMSCVLILFFTLILKLWTTGTLEVYGLSFGVRFAARGEKRGGKYNKTKRRKHNNKKTRRQKKQTKSKNMKHSKNKK